MDDYFEYNNPYNIMAMAIIELRKKDEQAFLDKAHRDSLMRPDDIDCVIKGVYIKHNKLKDEKRVLEQGICDEDEQAMLDFIRRHDFIYGLELLMDFLRCLKWDKIVDSGYVRGLRKDGFSGLNTNIDTTGIYIVPKVPSWNDSVEPYEENAANKKRWRTNWLPGINDELANIYYVDVEKLNTDRKCFEVRHFFEDSMPLSVKHSIRIAFAPITSKSGLDADFYNREGTSFFSCKEFKDEAHIEERVDAAYLEACRRKADILFFPEMLATQKLAQMNDPFFDVALEAEQENLYSPQLVLTPTRWSDYSNILYVHNGGGERVLSQHKQYAYPHKYHGRIYEEDIRNSKAIISVLHIPGLGRLAFPICMDFIQPEYSQVLVDVLRSNLHICPSYSSGKTIFEFSSLGSIAAGCITLWGNSCEVGYKKDEDENYLGFVSFPGRSKNYIKRFVPSCEGSCPGNCKGCLFLTDIVFGEEMDIQTKHIFVA